MTTNFPRKILVSPGYGAGWSTWNGPKKNEVAEYQPIIEFLERGGSTLSLEFDVLVERMKSELGLDYFYDGGKHDLEVEVVHGPYRIDEYDGHESVMTAEDLTS